MGRADLVFADIRRFVRWPPFTSVRVNLEPQKQIKITIVSSASALFAIKVLIEPNFRETRISAFFQSKIKTIDD